MRPTAGLLYAVGSTFFVVDVQSRPELNGQQATVIEPENENGRIPVKVGGEQILLKPQNLVKDKVRQDPLKTIPTLTLNTYPLGWPLACCIVTRTL